MRNLTSGFCVLFTICVVSMIPACGGNDAASGGEGEGEEETIICQNDSNCDTGNVCRTGTCNAASRTCSFVTLDGDEDGFPPQICGGTDCDDANDDVNPDAEERCNERDDDCDGEVDENFHLQTDDENCGECGTECTKDHFECREGNCECQEGLTHCGVECVDLQNNKQQCGVCFNHCSDRALCIDGMCECSDPQEIQCDGQCFSLEHSLQHCGRCNNACAEHLRCVQGECMCEGNQTECGNACVNITSNQNNCGQCGNECAGGTECRNGECHCPLATPTDCDGVCANTQTNAQHCGECGHDCGDEACRDGMCFSCPPSRPTSCGEQCVNLQTTTDHCGRCEFSCVLSATGNYCSDGQCRRCNMNEYIELCSIGPGQAVCVNTNHDNSHCSRCGNRCGQGDVCCFGHCVPRAQCE